MSPTTAMLISRLEAQLKSADNDGTLFVPADLTIKATTLRTLLTTIRELEAEAKKRHKKPSYAERGKPTYYSPE